MGCVSNKNLSDVMISKTKTTKFTPLQLQLLNLMYLNLAKRCRNTILSRETFNVFFHASGLIGQILFLKFDTSKTGLIPFQNFLQAFEVMLKGSVRERADVLFDLYDLQRTGGVTYQQLLKILFSYPIEQLNQMLIEQPFLKYIGEGQLSYYFGAEQKKIEERNIIEEVSENSENSDKDDIKKIRRGSMYDPSSSEFIKIQTDFRMEVEKQYAQAKLKKNMPVLKKYQLGVDNKEKRNLSTCTTIDQFKKNRKNPRIQSNISFLTKKYANFLFLSQKLDKDKDQFSKQSFYKLIQSHPALFNVYLSGFHTYAWQEDGGQPQYLSITPWIAGYAEEVYQDNSDTVFLKYIKTTVFVFDSQKSKLPNDIINLQGLNVDKVEKNNRFAIVFKHRDGLYPAKQYYFKTKEIQEQWLKQLAQFRQSSIFDQYVKLQRIGGGNFSNVFRGKDKKTEKEVAIKVIQNFKLSTAEREVIKRQCGILRQCHNPNIIKFIGEFKTKTHLYIVTQILKEGDLFEYTKKNGFLEQYEAAIILKQLAETILYINKDLGIIHRDLKPENVMLVMNDQKKMVKRVKIIDFGFGVYKDKINELPLKQKFAGTPGFIAPEVYNQQDYDEKIDTFSLGIILYFMLCGYLPFQSSFLEQIADMTKTCTYSLVNAHWANVSQKAKDLIYKVLTFKQNRITTKQVAEHPWLQNTEELKEYAGRNRKTKILF